MKRGFRYAISAGALIFVVLVLLLRKNAIQSEAPNLASTGLSNATQLKSDGAALFQQENNRPYVPLALITELNKFISGAKPYGLDKPIQLGEITGVTNYPKSNIVFETRTHLAEFFGTKLRTFLATHDMSNPVTDPQGMAEAMRKWYQATARWSEQEALGETHRILGELGIRAEWTNHDVRADPITVKNPQGESVRVTPFYRVTLEGPSGTVTAEFRMGQSGPGRLTEWVCTMRSNVQ